MCKCTPNIKTPFCGKPGCQWPEQKPRQQVVHPVFTVCGFCGTWRSSPCGEACRWAIAGDNKTGLYPEFPVLS